MPFKPIEMTLIDKAFALKNTAPFEAVELELLLPFADVLVLAQYSDGDALFEVNEQAHHMFFLVDGRVELQTEEGQVLQVLKPGSYFGEESLFSGLPRSYSANSQGESSLLVLTRTHLFLMIEESPLLATGFLKEYASLLTASKRGK